MARISSLTVFCGSSPGRSPAHVAAAQALGREAARRGIRIVFGGGAVGIMGTLADAVLQAGGEVIGVMPDFLCRAERVRTDLSELVIVDSMHERKARMFDLACGFVVLSGGLGSLDEVFEVMTWRQLGLHDKPIVILDVAGYWQPWHALIDAVIDEGFAAPSARDLVLGATTPEEVFAALDQAPEPAVRGRPGRL